MYNEQNKYMVNSLVCCQRKAEIGHKNMSVPI